jgi:hypothetical protein
MKSLVVTLAAAALLSVAAAASASAVTYNDVVRVGKPVSLRVTTHRPASPSASSSASGRRAGHSCS